MHGDPDAELVGPVDRGGEHVVRPQRGQVAGVAVDPVADQLHPAVAEPGLLLHRGHQAGRLDLDADVTQVALRPGDVLPGADEPRQVVAALHHPVVHRHAGVPQQQRAGVPVLGGLPEQRLLVGPPATGRQPDVAVAVDQPGQHPAAVGDGLGAGQRLVRQPPVDRVEVALLALGQQHPPHVQRSSGHAGGV